MPEPYQLIMIGIGAGATRPVNAPAGDEVADGGIVTHFNFGFEALQASIYAYGRGSADLNLIRSRVTFTIGARPRLPVQIAAFRPFVGLGIGLLWLQPGRLHEQTLDREFAPRLEGSLGLDWQPVRGFVGFLEYQASASRHLAVFMRDDPLLCPGAEPCPLQGSDRLTHVGHVVLVGGRFQIF